MDSTKFFAVFFQFAILARVSTLANGIIHPPTGKPKCRKKDDDRNQNLYIHEPILVPQFPQQHPVDGLNLATAFLNVLREILAYIIYIIKEIAEGVQNLIGLCLILAHLRVGNNLDTQMLNVHVDVVVGHDGITVEVDSSRFLAMDVQAARAERLDFRVVAQRLHKQVPSSLPLARCRRCCRIAMRWHKQ